MKRKAASKAVATLLAVAVIAGTVFTAPTTAWAMSTSKTIGTSSGAVVNSADDVISSTMLDFAKEGLQELAGMTNIPILKYGVGKFFDMLFSGSDKSSIQDSLSTINGKLDQISQDIQMMYNNLQNQADKNQLSNKIDAYENNIRLCAIVVNQFNTEQQTISQMPDGPDKVAKEQDFLKRIYNNTSINGSDFCTQVQNVGEQLTADSATSNKDLFGTFDDLTRYSYKWEQQGYDQRRTFQASALGLYVSMAAYAQLCLAAAQDQGWPINSSSVSPQTQYKRIMDYNAAVQKMATTESVVERPSNQRYYQVRGHECLLASIADSRRVKGNMPDNWSGTPDDFRNQLQNHQFKNLFTNQSLGVSNSNPTAQWLHQVYLDYGGGKELSEIFFDPAEGNISKSGPMDGAAFITNDEQFDWKKCSGLFHIETWYDFTESATVAFNDSSTKVMKLANGEIPASYGFLYLDDQPNVNFIGLAVLNQGVTPVDFVPPVASSMGDTFDQPSSSATVLSQPSSSDASQQASQTDLQASSQSTSQVSSATVQNPHTGNDGLNHVLLWIPIAFLVAGISGLLVWKRRSSHADF